MTLFVVTSHVQKFLSKNLKKETFKLDRLSSSFQSTDRRLKNCHRKAQNPRENTVFNLERENLEREALKGQKFRGESIYGAPYL